MTIGFHKGDSGQLASTVEKESGGRGRKRLKWEKRGTEFCWGKGATTKVLIAICCGDVSENAEGGITCAHSNRKPRGFHEDLVIRCKIAAVLGDRY